MRPPGEHLAYTVSLQCICQEPITHDIATWWLQLSRVEIKLGQPREGRGGQEEAVPAPFPAALSSSSFRHGQCTPVPAFIHTRLAQGSRALS